MCCSLKATSLTTKIKKHYLQKKFELYLRPLLLPRYMLVDSMKAEKKKKKKRKKCGCKTSVDMTDGREIYGHPNIRLIYGSTFSQFFDFPHKTFVSKFDFLIFSFSFFFLSSSISLCNEGKVIAQKYST